MWCDFLSFVMKDWIFSLPFEKNSYPNPSSPTQKQTTLKIKFEILQSGTD
jgi:hypothetical protein